ncbi:hypothetical protein FIU87_04305 [Bacillus sp. THAF10]|uniref:TIGR04104 family putative zinc finger protein n=1 Tax=Bacillus sp. THAF10 TaxID=2587848 RepID=UPI0012693E51|nr:TIGR04104 family putative zinc finger protein [Bacillus sp. THAF10]QFT87869.1 hypothetical protein FIU87_04305 [Bacillus sp. THAF10]
MNTPTCMQCKRQWNWKMAWRKMFTFKQEIICPLCGGTQYLTKKSRKKLAIYPFIVPFVNIPLIYYDVDIIVSAMVYLAVFLLLIFWMPNLYELSNENEPLW